MCRGTEDVPDRTEGQKQEDDGGFGGFVSPASCENTSILEGVERLPEGEGDKFKFAVSFGGPTGERSVVRCGPVVMRREGGAWWRGRSWECFF